MSEESRAAADTLIADAIASHRDTAEVHLEQLESERNFLLTRLTGLINRLDNRHMESADVNAAQDVLAPEKNRINADISQLQKELGKEWNIRGEGIKVVQQKLQILRGRIESLEAMMPGNEVLN